MSVELANTFFERDLSPAESEALEQSLQRDPEAAERLLALAERDYQATGLPVPRWAARRPSRLRGAWLWLALLVGVGGLAVAVGVRRHGPLRIERVDDELPLGAAIELSTDELQAQARPIEGPAAAPRAPEKGSTPGRQGRRLGVLLRLKAACQAQVFVRAADGRLVDRLFTGRLAAGEQRIEWDGLDAQGKRAAPGDYEVVVQAGGQELLRPLRLKAPTRAEE